MVKLNEYCEQDYKFYITCKKFDENLEYIFLKDNPHILIRNLKFGKKLFKLFPELEPMNQIFQDKKRNHSLFDHSVSVLKYCYKETNYFSTLLAAFLHDYGKIHTFKDNFKRHDSIGVKLIGDFLKKYDISNEHIVEIKMMMTYHTNASQYQREPNWTDEAVKRFIKRTHPLTLEVIKIGKADKRSSHDYGPYLEPYKELEDRCIAMFKGGLEV